MNRIKSIILYLSLNIASMLFSQELDPTMLTHQLHYFENPYILYDYQIEHLPVRGLDAYLSLMPGITFQDGTMHIRGGLGNTNQYLLNGVDITTPYDYNREVYIIPEAIQMISLSTANTSATYGGAGSGYIFTKLKRGDNQYRISLNSQTDKYAAEGDKLFGTYSYRDHYVTALASGPIIKKKAHFFIALENEDIGDTQKRFSKGYEFNNLVDMNPGNPDVQAGTPNVVDKMKYPDGFTPKNSSNRWAMNAVINAEFKPFDLEITSAYDWQKLYVDDRPMLNILNDRAQYLERYTFFINGKIEHQITENQSYDLSLAYIQSQKEVKDDYFGSNWKAWKDSAKIADHTDGKVTYRDAWRPPYNYLLNGFTFSRNGTLLNDYSIFKHTNWQIAGNYKNTIIANNIISAGFSYKTHTFREYSIDPYIMAHTDPNYRSSSGDHIAGGYYPSLEDISFERYSQYLGNVYGFDRFGKEIDEDGIEGPGNPVYFSAYVEDRLSIWKLNAYLGLRYDYFKSDEHYLRDPSNLQVNPETGTILDWKWKQKKPVKEISPRIGINYNPVQFINIFINSGRFVQFKNLLQSYDPSFSQTISGGFFYIVDSRMFIPEAYQVWQNDIGIRINILNLLQVNANGYYNANKYVDDDNFKLADNCGFIFNLSSCRFLGFQGLFNLYLNLNDASDTNPKTYISAVDRQSIIVSPESFLENDQKVRGMFNLNYQFGNHNGGLLSQLNANLMFTFNSGHPYTKVINAGGQSSPYDSGVDYMFDTRGSLAIEPTNSSTIPWNYRFDLSIDRTVNLFKNIDLKFYIHIINLLNTKNVINVYTATGEADDDGFITDPDKYEPYYNTYGGQQYLDMYNAINIENGQAYWDVLGKQLYDHPRQILFGMQISY